MLNSKRLLISGLALFLAGCSTANDSFLVPGGPIAAAQRAHLIHVTLLSMIAMLPVFILVPLILWRYRYNNKQACYKPNWQFSRTLDMVMWGVPFTIIFLLSIELWYSNKALDPYKPIESEFPSLEVQVVGLDWKWLFIYPQYGIASIGEMAFPADRPVALKLTSDTVMQSFLVSSLAGQIYTMPGMETQLHLKADRPGVYKGENTQFNGIGFTSQKFNAVGMTLPDFENWVAKVKSQGVALNDSMYDFLGNRSTKAEIHAAIGTDTMPKTTVYFSSVEPDLYSSILKRYHTGHAIPSEEQPGGKQYRAKLINPIVQSSLKENNARRVLP